MPDEESVLHVHVENLRDRVAALEHLISNVATKQDVQAVEGKISDLVIVLNTGTGIYKFVLGLGALFAAIGAIIFGFKTLLKEFL